MHSNPARALKQGTLSLLLPLRSIWRHISLTWPSSHRYRHSPWPVDVTELFPRFCCWTLIWLLRHWAWLCQGYWRYRCLIDWFIHGKGWNGGPVGRNWLHQWFQMLNQSFTLHSYVYTYKIKSSWHTTDLTEWKTGPIKQQMNRIINVVHTVKTAVATVLLKVPVNALFENLATWENQKYLQLWQEVPGWIYMLPGSHKLCFYILTMADWSQCRELPIIGAWHDPELWSHFKRLSHLILVLMPCATL